MHGEVLAPPVHEFYLAALLPSKLPRSTEPPEVRGKSVLVNLPEERGAACASVSVVAWHFGRRF